MIDEFKDYIWLVAVTIVGATGWFTLKSRVQAIEVVDQGLCKRMEALENAEPPKVDLRQVAENAMAIQRLQMINERAEEQRENLAKLMERTESALDRQATKQDEFQKEMLTSMTKLSTELQERTKSSQG